MRCCWLPVFVLPAGFFFLVLTWIIHVLRSVCAIFGKHTSHHADATKKKKMKNQYEFNSLARSISLSLPFYWADNKIKAVNEVHWQKMDQKHWDPHLAHEFRLFWRCSIFVNNIFPCIVYTASAHAFAMQQNENVQLQLYTQRLVR